MKHFTLKFFFSMVMVLFGFSNSFAATGDNGTITLCLSGKGATYQFTSPAYTSVEVNNQTTFVTVDDFVRMGDGIMLVFTVTLDEPSAASTVCINTTATQHSSEHPIMNGVGRVQVYVPLYFTSTSRNQIYISLR